MQTPLSTTPKRPLRFLGLSTPPAATSRPHAPSRNLLRTRPKTGSSTAGKDPKDADPPLNYAQAAAAIPRTFHSTSRDLATPRPFQDPEHRQQVTGHYSAGDAEPNELLFLQVLPKVTSSRSLLAVILGSILG